MGCCCSLVGKQSRSCGRSRLTSEVRGNEGNASTGLSEEKKTGQLRQLLSAKRHCGYDRARTCSKGNTAYLSFHVRTVAVAVQVLALGPSCVSPASQWRRQEQPKIAACGRGQSRRNGLARSKAGRRFFARLLAPRRFEILEGTPRMSTIGWGPLTSSQSDGPIIDWVFPAITRWRSPADVSILSKSSFKIVVLSKTSTSERTHLALTAARVASAELFIFSDDLPLARLKAGIDAPAIE
ncbi:hypothetical protein VTO42DRAFT_3628 [Malbranchea cinnamomea]